MWNRGDKFSTIDLTFLTTSLVNNRFISTITKEDLDFGSDHYPISTIISTNSLPFYREEKRRN